jgi:hypothetical protein
MMHTNISEKSDASNFRIVAGVSAFLRNVATPLPE